MGREESYGWDGLNCYDNNNSYPVADSGCTQVQCSKPTAESTAGVDWNHLDPTLYDYEQTLSPANVNFVGRQVTEQDHTGGGPDGCYFNGSAFDAYDKVTGGNWTVITGNKWHTDSVGYHSGAVSYYRNHGRAPCGTTFQQDMVIDCSSGAILYKTNTLSASITSTTVTSTRDGVSKSKTWP